MAALATSLLHSNTSSRIWDGLPPQSPPHSSATLKSAIPFFSADSRETTIISHRKMLLQLARASPLKGHTREVDQNAEQPGQKRSLRSAQETDDQQPQVGQESKDVSDVLRYVHQKLEGRLDASNADCAQQETEEDKLSAENIVGEGNLISGDTALKGSIVAGLLLVGVVGGFGAVSYIYREQINDFLLEFSDFIEGYGATGYALFVAVYAGLEILAIPAIPLTMSAGLLFGTLTGTIIVSVSGTIAATAAFLIARYLARDRILKLAEGNKKFLAIDKAIGENGFRVVALLRLSPLLPFSIGNYLYGLTSVKLAPYVLGSWLGMLPGTWAYVSAGAVGRAIIQQEAENGLGGGPEQLWTIGIGLLVTVIAAAYMTHLAKNAIKGIE